MEVITQIMLAVLLAVLALVVLALYNKYLEMREDRGWAPGVAGKEGLVERAAKRAADDIVRIEGLAECAAKRAADDIVRIRRQAAIKQYTMWRRREDEKARVSFEKARAAGLEAKSTIAAIRRIATFEKARVCIAGL
jgi:hypothetical protein